MLDKSRTCRARPCRLPPSMNARQRPGSPGKADQGRVLTQGPAGQPQRLGHVAEPVQHPARIQPCDRRCRIERVLHFDAARIDKAIGLSQGLGDHEDVTEDDGGIELEPADGLQRDFRGQLRGADQFEERIAPLELAVLGQGASGLSHQPDGGAVHRGAGAGLEEAASARPRRGAPSSAAGPGSRSGFISPCAMQLGGVDPREPCGTRADRVRRRRGAGALQAGVRAGTLDPRASVVECGARAERHRFPARLDGVSPHRACPARWGQRAPPHAVRSAFAVQSPIRTAARCWGVGPRSAGLTPTRSCRGACS